MSKHKFNVPAQLYHITNENLLTDLGEIAFDTIFDKIKYKTTLGVDVVASENLVNSKSQKLHKFRFNSNLFTESTSSFSGLINSLSAYFTNELSSIFYEVRLDTVATWTPQTDLINLQAWINANVTGDRYTGTKYWIKVLATYQVAALGAAETTFYYQWI
jgi:predicted Zn-dependent peptidase